ncbi:hypothetical protein LJC04_04170 [Ruminococcaceae bacterium OttesenSCG-928-O06]|nr:hypothetical protein [Ruminococcaceae bacterium OttesenSCG-928-O06]
MKRMKRIGSLLLCALLALGLFAACGGGGNGGGNVTYGRYVEEDISPEGMRGYPQSFVMFSDGSLDLITSDWSEDAGSSYLRWRSTDGGANWQQMDMSWTEQYINDYSEYYERGETPPEEISLGSMYPLESGDVLFQVYTWKYDASADFYSSLSELYRITPDGTITPFSIAEIEEAKAGGGNVHVQNMLTLPGGRLFLSLYIEPSQAQMNDPSFDWNSTERMAVYDVLSGEKIYDLPYRGWNVFANSTTLFINDYEKGFQAINIADGSPSTAPMPSEEMMMRIANSWQGSSFVDDENNFYMVTARGMDKITVEATEPEKVMDGLNYTYGSPLYSINSVAFSPGDDSMVMAVYDNQNYESLTGRLLRYVWDDDAVATSDNVLRVYSLYDNYSVRLGLSEFKRQNPDVTVQYETAFDPYADGGAMPMSRGGGTSGGGDTGMTEEDALRALNTELLNGTGPDVLILDGLPVESFIEKGILEDLAGVLDGNGDLLQPLVAPMYQDGKIYAVPTNFFVPTLFGESGYVESLADFDTFLAAIKDGVGIPEYIEYDPNWAEEEMNEYYQKMYGARPEEEQPVFYVESLSDLFVSFYASCAPAIFSEKTGINRENLAAFLQAVKDVSDRYGLADPEMMNMYGGGMVSSFSMGGYAQYDYSSTLNRYSQRQSRVGYSRLGSYNILQNVSYQIYYSGQNNNWGKVVDDTAQADTETLPALSPATISMPGLASGAYFPTLMVGVTTTTGQPELSRAFVAAMLSEDVQKYDMGNGFPVTRSAMQYQYANYTRRDEYMVQQGINMIPFDYETLLSSLETPFYTNSYLQDVIYKPVEDFCTGNTTLEAAVDQIVSETELYFAERQ